MFYTAKKPIKVWIQKGAESSASALLTKSKINLRTISHERQEKLVRF